MKKHLAPFFLLFLLVNLKAMAQVATLIDQPAVDNYVEVRTQPNQYFYNYAPDVIYFNGMYHMYWCGGVGGAGDYILHAQSATAWGPFMASNSSAAFSYDVALNPNWNSNDFDGYETCDPSVMQVSGTFYLYYGGLGTQSNNSAAGAIGVATSTDGVHFSRANAGKPIVSPVNWVANTNAYGAGQPAVFYIAPYYYLSLTDTTAPGGSGQYMIRALDPLFQNAVQELTAPGTWTNRGPNSRSGQYMYLEAYSIDIAYDALSGNLLIASDQAAGQNWVYVISPTTFQNYGYFSLAGTWADGASIAKNPDRTMLSRSSCNAPLDLNIFKGDSPVGQNTGDGVATWNISRSQGIVQLAPALCQTQTQQPNSCQISQISCPNYPGMVGAFEDTWGDQNLGASANPAECMQRAADYYEWCGIPTGRGNTTTAVFSAAGRAQQTVTIGACQITQSSCPNFPGIVGTFEDVWGDLNLGASTNPAECMQRASDYYNWCGSPASSTTSATFYANGQIQQSTTVGGQYPMSNAVSNDAIWAATNASDGNPGSVYSSAYFASSQNDRNTFLAAWTAGGAQSVSKVILTARMQNGAPLGFATNYDVYLTAPDNSAWNYMGNFNAQANGNGVATINLGSGHQTYGVLIVPRVLGVDDNGNHYFQLGEINLAR